MTPAVRSRSERTRTLVRGLVAATAVAAVSALLMLLATVQGVPQFRAVPQPQVTRTAEAAPEPTATSEPLPELAGEADPGVMRTVTLVLLALAATALLALLVVVVVRALRRAWDNRALQEREGAVIAAAAVATAAEVQPDAEVIQRGIAAAIRRIEVPALPGDAIVAAWVGVEEAAADSGVVRGVSETPGEFAVRIVTRRSAIDEDARRLLALYEGVRFGGHIATEGDRSDARRLLERIEQEWR
jgi:hypothetical protein